MSEKKKLQVFVSSTYQDLREERQAAVEAILTAGHIPAGMELFAAGDESQMNVIKRWIEESDVFLLILGGRYGTIETTSGLSYIHHEYREALARGKPVFAVVVNPEHHKKRVRKHGLLVTENEHPTELSSFREEVMTRLVKFWSDPRDIKLAIHEAMAEFARRPELVGWLPGNKVVDTGPLAEELARLAKENSDLRHQVTRLSGPRELYNGLYFDELVGLLRREIFPIQYTEDAVDQQYTHDVLEIAHRGKLDPPRLLHALWALHDRLSSHYMVPWGRVNIRDVMQRLEYYNLAEKVEDGSFSRKTDTFRVAADGKKFILRLMVERKRLFFPNSDPSPAVETNAPAL